MYKLENNIIIRLEDKAFIPSDPGNTDYQAYQSWLEEGNTPQIAHPSPVEDQILASDWAKFYDSLLISSCFSAARQAASQSLAANVAYTDCSMALGLARQGTVNVPAIQTAISSLLSLDFLSAEQKREFIDLMGRYSIELVLDLTD